MKGDVTILGEDIRFKGKFYAKSSLTIKGYFRGYIQAPGELRISPVAKVEADIEAEKICIEGEMQGNAYASKKIEIAKTARVVADLHTDDLQIESGSRFRGTCVMN